MNTTTPKSFSRRSFVSRKLSAATFTEVAGSAMAADFANGRKQAQSCGLLDLSTLPRTGFRGTSASAHLQGAGFPMPTQPNLATASNWYYA